MLSQTSNGLINIINNSVIPLNTKNTVKDTEITAKANVIYSQVYFYGNYTIRNNFNESIYNNINTTILQKGIVHSKPLNFKLNSVCNNCKFYCHFSQSPIFFSVSYSSTHFPSNFFLIRYNTILL